MTSLGLSGIVRTSLGLKQVTLSPKVESLSHILQIHDNTGCGRGILSGY